MIVLLVGNAGSGKDTVGRILERIYAAPNIAFADPIKALASIVFDFTSLDLYGPSSARNAEIKVDWDRAAHSVRSDGLVWVDTDSLGDRAGRAGQGGPQEVGEVV